MSHHGGMVRSLITAALSITLLLPTTAAAEQDPGAADSFRETHGQVVALLDAHAPDPKVQAQVDALIDYHFMAVDALGGPERYAERCGQRCAEYEDLLAAMIRRSYLKRLRAKDRGALKIIGEDVRPKASKVDTRVRFIDAEGKTRQVKISYVMHRVAKAWKVREIFTDGVSLTDNYRHELKRLYREGGIDRVVEQLQAKLAESDAD